MPSLPPPHPKDFTGTYEHGTTRGYRTHKCSCGACRFATSEHARAYRADRAAGVAHMLPALGARRRLLSLGSVGYSQHVLGREAGMSQRSLSRIVTRQVEEVYLVTHETVVALFDRLGAQPPPVVTRVWHRGWGPNKLAMTIRVAREAGGVPPMLWDDEALDDPDGMPWIEHDAMPDPWQRWEPERAIEDLVDMAESGETVLGAARRLEIEPNSIYSLAHRGGRPDLVGVLIANGREQAIRKGRPELAS